MHVGVSLSVMASHSWSSVGMGKVLREEREEEEEEWRKGMTEQINARSTKIKRGGSLQGRRGGWGIKTETEKA